MMHMKKSTTRMALMVVIFIIGIVGYYAYLSGRHKNNSGDEAKMTAVQLVLSRDLKNDYPATVKEVVKYYAEIQKCYYGMECTNEEIEQLGIQARLLFDEELLAANELDSYLVQLAADIVSFKQSKRVMTSAAVASSANVDFFTEDGHEFARIHCGYTVMENNQSKAVKMVYLLRRDADRKWKIYGWDLAENVKLEDE